MTDVKFTKKRVMFLFSVFILLFSVMFVSSYTNQYSRGGGVHLDVISGTYLKVVSQTGFDEKLNFILPKKCVYDKKTDTYTYDINICHKDYKRNKNDCFEVSKSETECLDIYPIKSVSSELSSVDTSVNLRDNECISYSVPFRKNEIVKFGFKTTYIILEQDNVTFTITPENKVCNYLYCTSEIILLNNGNNSVLINSSDLFMEVDSEYSWIEFDYDYEENVTRFYYDCYYCNITGNYTELNNCSYDDGYYCNVTGNYTELVSMTKRVSTTDEVVEIVIEPDEQKTFVINSVMSSQNFVFKYNVSINYFGTEYKIDPYFNTTNSSFNEGVYNRTFLNESGFVQLNSTYYNGSYTSKIFSTGENISWDNISWFQELCYQCELPDNKMMETGDFREFADMSDNVFLMHMNEAGGNITDYSGEGNNGSYNGVLYSQPGRLKTAIGFDGINDYIDCGNISQSPTNYTIEFWSKRGTLAGYRVVFSLSSGYDVSLWTYEDGRIAFGSAGGGWDSWVNVWADKTEFHHIVIVVYKLTGANNMRLFFDGVDKGFRTATSVSGSWDDVKIGGDWNYFNGTIDEFALYDRSLSMDKILNHYKRGALKLNLTVRSCNNSGCVGENYIDVNDSSFQDLLVENNIYFQYKYDFYSLNLSHVPKLYNVTIGYSNLSCVPNWVPVYEECLINDSRLKYYVDENNCSVSLGIPADNGTYVYCNYCSEDITGPYYEPEECPVNQTQLRWYIDNNYGSCCNITGLFSDCSVDYPPYMNQTVNCSFLQTEILLIIDETPYLTKRIDFIAYMNVSNSTKCWSYVKSENGVLQTNPRMTKYSKSFIFKKREESREYFTPVQGQIQAYYTKENLIPDKQFILGVTCSLDNGTIITGESYINPKYDDLRKVSARSVWVVREIPTLIITFVLLLVVLGLLIYAFKK